jgi:heme exporter protein D
MPTSPGPLPAPEALRAEHDALARRLAVRASVDLARRGLYQVFFGLLFAGLSVKLGWDRFGVLPAGVVRKAHAGPPLFLWIATVVTVVLLLLAIRSLLRSRRLARDEDALFVRYRALRAALGLDA